VSETGFLRITPMTAADLAAVMALELENPSPWGEQQLTSELAQETGWQWLARQPETGAVIGYIIGRSMAGEAEILRLATAAAQRCRGVAQALLAHALAQLCTRGTTACFLEVRAANSTALHLYTKNGFTIAGTRKNYYTAPMEDAVVMTKLLRQPEGVST